MSLATNITALAQAIAADVKALTKSIGSKGGTIAVADVSTKIGTKYADPRDEWTRIGYISAQIPAGRLVRISMPTTWTTLSDISPLQVDVRMTVATSTSSAPAPAVVTGTLASNDTYLLQPVQDTTSTLRIGVPATATLSYASATWVTIALYLAPGAHITSATGNNGWLWRIEDLGATTPALTATVG